MSQFDLKVGPLGCRVLRLARAVEVSLLGTGPLGCNLLPVTEGTIHSDSIASDEWAATRREEPYVMDAFTTPEKKGRPVFPSDHFGLHAVFAFSA